MILIKYLSKKHSLGLHVFPIINNNESYAIAKYVTLCCNSGFVWALVVIYKSLSGPWMCYKL